MSRLTISATMLRLERYHEPAVALLNSPAAQAAYAGRPFSADQWLVINHYATLVDLVEGAVRAGKDPWPYVREWALGRCRESARLAELEYQRLATTPGPFPPIDPRTSGA